MAPRIEPPRVLVIDDLYGRSVAAGNMDRAAICMQLRLEDDSPDAGGEVVVRDPLARAVFCRGQRPARAIPGDVVENDLQGTLRVVESGWEGRPAGTPPWALVLLDLRFRCGTVTGESELRYGPGVPTGRSEDEAASLFFGLRLLEEIQRRHPQLPVVILSDAPRELVSRQFTSLGAVAFLAKGEAASAEKFAEHLRRHALMPDPSGVIVGTSIPLLLALRNARRAAAGSDSVLIRGETGTGKELLARFIYHHDSRRSAGPLVIVDSGTLSSELYASELFGHVRGAFTTAVADRVGHIVEAHRGVLFLDEIGNIDGAVQRGLLRVLQEKQVRPVGGSRSRDVDVRFLFATNEDIESRAAAEDGFRLDLLERIRQGGTVVLPPLRERIDDLPSLVEAIVREAEASTRGAVPRKIDADVLDLIARQPWPGNIRQLRSCLVAAVRARPDVEHLVPVHLDLPTVSRSGIGQAQSDDGALANPIRAAAAMLQRLDPAALPPHELLGGYRTLETAFARLSMRYLRACVETMRKPTMRNPAGEVLVQPAVKLMLGSPKLTATQAYDFVIRLRNVSPAVMEEWDADRILGPLYERARAQRRAGRRTPDAAGDLERTHG